MKNYLMVTVLAVAVFAGTTPGYSQDWSIGGNAGLSLLDGSAGFHLAPMLELRLNRNIAAGSEFSINTQYGAPLIWHPYVKYYFAVHGSQLKPYAGAGPLLAFNVPNGPCLGFLLTGGVEFPIADGLYLSPNLAVGPVFGFGGGEYPYILSGYYWGYQTYGLASNTIPSATVLAFSLRGGIRYEI